MTDEAKNVLLLLPPNREPRAAVEEAIGVARARGGRLFVVAVLDPEIVERVATTLTEVGFMGERVGEHVRDTLVRELRARAEALARDVADRARQAQVPAEWQVEEGNPGEVCRRLVTRERIGVAVLVAERRSWLTRLLARTSVRLPALPGCEVRVMEEDEGEAVS